MWVGMVNTPSGKGVVLATHDMGKVGMLIFSIARPQQGHAPEEYIRQNTRQEFSMAQVQEARNYVIELLNGEFPNDQRCIGGIVELNLGNSGGPITWTEEQLRHMIGAAEKKSQNKVALRKVVLFASKEDSVQSARVATEKFGANFKCVAVPSAEIDWLNDSQASMTPVVNTANFIKTKQQENELPNDGS